MATTTDLPSRSRAPALKFLAVIVLTMLMTVPLFFVWLVLAERQGRQSEAEADIASSWGHAQAVSGPYLFVPYIVTERHDVDGRTVEREARRVAVFLPQTLTADADADTELRARGLFDVTVFTAGMQLAGRFARPDFSTIADTPSRILWNEATIALRIADVRAVTSNTMLTLGTTDVPFRPGLPAWASTGQGIHAAAGSPDTWPMEGLDFRLALTLRGSTSLMITPIAEDTEVRLTSPWPHPSFTGAFLPVTRNVSADGFSAAWRVPYLARSFPQSYVMGEVGPEALDATAFGVRFVQPVDFYALVDRALKYAVLFVGLAFLAVFLIETVLGARVHVIQYLLIGAAQVVFYLLLLALSEHWGFDLAYATASGATVALTALYGIWALGGFLRALIAGTVLALLYGVLFVLIGQEDTALLVGSVLVFVALALTMLVTRKVDWYALTPDAGR